MTPNIVKVPGVRHKFVGLRPHGLEGGVLHFDAGRAWPRDPNPRRGALECLKYAQTQGFAFVTAARDGTIFEPENMDYGKWGSHAGTSLCPVTGRTGVSRYNVGVEINSPGVVYPTADPNVFVPWFEAVLNKSGAVMLDKQGRATPRKSTGEHYSAAEVRKCAPQGNIRAGTYVAFPKEQIEGVIAWLLWLDKQFDTFRLDRVFGHDEVAPTRKMDPGGALGALPGPAMTMAAFRAELARRANGGSIPVDQPPLAPAPVLDKAARPLLRMGDEGPPVRQLQAMLLALGFRAPQTGKFQWATDTAVKQFQSAAGVGVNGEVGNKETWPALDRAYAALVKQGDER